MTSGAVRPEVQEWGRISTDRGFATQIVDLTSLPAADEQGLLDAVEERLTAGPAVPRWERQHAALLVGADLLMTVLACVPLLAVIASRQDNWVPVALVPLLWLLLSFLGRSYEPRNTASMDTQLRHTCNTGVRAAAVTFAAGFAADWDPPRAAVLVSLALLIALPPVGRALARQVLHGVRRSGHWLHRVVAIGPAE